jgi:cytochrome c oxidase subunit 2
MVVLGNSGRTFMTRLHFRKYPTLLSTSLAATLFAVILSYGQEEPAKPGRKNADNRKVQKASVLAERFNFTPSRIKVKEGTLLEITLSSDDTFHGFRIPSANINLIIPARGRGSVKVDFEAKEKGSYPFECSRPCGAGHTMMRGVIIVE